MKTKPVKPKNKIEPIKIEIYQTYVGGIIDYQAILKDKINEIIDYINQNEKTS